MLFNVSKALCINVSTTIFVFFQGSFQTTTNRWWDLADSSAFIWSVQIAVSSNGFVLYWVFPMTFALCLSAVTIMTEQYGLATRATSPERTWKPRDALTNRLEVSGWRMVVPLYNKVASLLQILPFHFAACLFSPPPSSVTPAIFHISWSNTASSPRARAYERMKHFQSESIIKNLCISHVVVGAPIAVLYHLICSATF